MRTALPCLVLLAATLAHAQPQPAPAAQQPPPAFDPATTRVLYEVPGMKAARGERGVFFKAAGERQLMMDVYRPARAGKPAPAIVFVSGAEEVRSWGLFQDYGRLAAAHGFVGIVADKRYARSEEGFAQGTEDTLDALRFVREHARRFGVDPERVCVWTFSAGGSLAGLALRADAPPVRCLVAYYGLGLGGVKAQLRAEGARQVPTLAVRAGRDMKVLNDNIDAFAAEALAVNAPFTLVNYPEGVHAFEVSDARPEPRTPENRARTRDILQLTFAFLEAATR